LEDMRKSHEQQIRSEKDSYDKEFEKLREREKLRIAEYRKNQEENLTRIRDGYRATLDELQKNAKG